MKIRHSTVISAAFALASLSAIAQPVDFGDGLENLSPSRVLSNHDGRHDYWKGIGRILSDDGSTCTATLIDTRTANSTGATPAYVLTNGHCLYRKHHGEIITDQPVVGTVIFNYFADTIEQQQPYSLKRVNWSSMQGVDLAIVELQASLNDLIAAGIEPLQMAEQTPQAGKDILIVGAPLALETPYLRMAACTHQPSGEFIEHPWVWRHTVKNQCQDLKEGSSGSPLLTRETNQVFAVINTTTLFSQGANPAITSTGGGNFGSPISYLRNCFVAGEFITEPELCPLFPTFSVTPADVLMRYTKLMRNADGSEIYPDWNMAFSIDRPFYRYKTVRQSIECENPRDYSPAIDATNARINAQIGPQAGNHMLCLLGVDSADERPSPGLMRNALTVATELQPAGPVSPAQVQFRRSAHTYIISWNHDTKLIKKQTFKAGPVQSTDCNDPSGYKGAWRTLILSAQRLPAKVCTYAYDYADQQSEVREDVLEAGEA